MTIFLFGKFVEGLEIAGFGPQRQAKCATLDEQFSAFFISHEQCVCVCSDVGMYMGISIRVKFSFMAYIISSICMSIVILEEVMEYPESITDARDNFFEPE